MESDSESDASIGTTVARSGSATEQVSDHSTLADTESVTTDSSTPSTSSSAAAERVFSVLQSTKQNVSLEDYICTSVMLQCNHK